MAETEPIFKEAFKLASVPGVGHPGAEQDQLCPAKSKLPVNCSELQSTSKRVPKGLIGSRCTADIKVAGHQSSCLLDTGSQVTTIPVSFYNEYLSKQPVQSLHELLHVEGAAGQNVPYLGYIETTVTFPKDFVGSILTVPTLALIVPDVRPGFPTSILIGMNTLEALYDQFRESDYSSFLPNVSGYRAVLQTLQVTFQQSCSDPLGVVTLLSKCPVLVPAGHAVLLKGSAKVSAPTSQYAVVQHPELGLPGGLCVSSCLVAVQARSPHQVPVMVRNESEQDVYIPPLTIIAELGAYECVVSEQHVTSLPGQEVNSSPLVFNFGESPLSLGWKNRITTKLSAMSNVFSHHDLDFGCTSQVKHHINLHDNTPFKHRARPIHPQDIEAVRKHLRELLDAGVIRESESPFSSPIVVVKKKNGDIRLCIDYRKLNLQTVKDAYALPNLEESFSALTGSKWFSVLDLKSGYYQIEMNEADKPKTAFVTPLGFWEFNRMPQGVTNAPSTFQRLMEKCMGDLHLKEVLVFLDDLIIFSNTLEEHESRLLRVLSRLEEYGLKLSPEKCKFFQTSVKYLGHIVSEKGVETDPEKVAALKSWPVPTNLKTLRSFLGFAGYYRRFIKGYSAIAKPLNDLTRGCSSTRKNSKARDSKTHHFDPNQPFGSRWSSDCQLAFKTLIEKLTSAPVLGFADPKRPYILHTDASTIGLGAALYQEQDGKLRAIAFASRGLSSSESHYPAHKLEFLALKWSVVEKFQDYLYGANFTVVTDSNPLTYILTSAKLDATSHRWLAALSTFSFKLQYRAGRQNLDADALSRRPHADSPNDESDQELLNQFARQHLPDPGDPSIPSEVVNAICQSCLLRTEAASTLIESLSLNANVLPESYIQDPGLPVVPALSHRELQDKQRADLNLREVIHQIETGEKVPPTAREELPEIHLLLRELNKLELIEGVLYRKRQDNEQMSYQLVLPEDLRSTVLQSLHDDMGHMGIERTLDLARTRFYWPKMPADVERKVKTCGRCIRRKALPERAAPLVSIQTSRPLELICMDFLSLEPDTSNTKDILVLTDHFTKFAIAIPTANQKARTVAKCLWDNFIVYYGIPERLHSDQGPDFESKLIKELCEVAGIKKCRTTPYHPRGNPVERFNRTLLNMLGTLESKQKAKWKDYVKPLVHAYNCTRNETTGYTPYELMFGRSPRLPVDLAFGLPMKEEKCQPHSQYVQSLKSRLKESYNIASKNAAKASEKNKSRFDQRVTPSKLELGDRVLVRSVRLRGKHKISDKWEQDIYVVVDQAGDLPVYTVKPERCDGPKRTLHRDLLLPCGFLPDVDAEPTSEASPVSRPKTRQQCKMPLDSEDFEEEGNPPESTSVSINQSPMRFTVERVHKQASFPSVASNHRPSPTLPGSEPIVDKESESEHLPEETLPMISDHLPEPAEPVAPVEINLPDYSPPPVSPEFIDVPLTEEAEESVDPKLPVSNVSEPLNFDQIPTSVEPEPVSTRSVRQRLPPKRLQYSSLGNPLISVVQTLLHGISDALNPANTTSSVIHVV